MSLHVTYISSQASNPAGSRHHCGLRGSRAREVVARQRRTHPGDASTAGASRDAPRGGGDGRWSVGHFLLGFRGQKLFFKSET